MKAIEVQNISKSYEIGKRLSGSLRHSLSYLVELPKFRLKKETFWALRSVSFDLEAGQALGIIGKNGSGKSTLLKILARVTQPSEGRIVINGRLSAMLEVGAGFHPELTGRENVFLNGNIMGMSKQEIRRELDAIVAFAELERMIDTPVKHFSSGMYVRLAFAVATYLRADILLLDEVLAVGDVGFQKKCLALMEEKVRLQGKTILYVSHDLSAVESLCERSIRLEEGCIADDGDSKNVIKRYLNETGTITTGLSNTNVRQGSGAARITAVDILDSQSNSVYNVSTGDDCQLSILIANQTGKHLAKLALGIGLNAPSGQRVSHLSNETHNEWIELPAHGYARLTFRLTKLNLMPGIYTLNFYLTTELGLADWLKNGFTFVVKPGFYFSSGKLPPYNQTIFLIDHQFSYEISQS